MRFRDRSEAGQLLTQKLKKYKNKEVIVYALPRGGVQTAVEIARFLNAPLDLVITRKISHPSSPEYAIAATAENGHIIGARRELLSLNEEWLDEQIQKKRQEAVQRRLIYRKGREMLSADGKIAILVDDGVATGLTLRVGIVELRHHNPKKLIVAVPVVPKSTAKVIREEADELVTLTIPSDDTFLGAVGAYYANFSQIDDKEVINMLDAHEAWLRRKKAPKVFTIKDGRGNTFIDFDEP